MGTFKAVTMVLLLQIALIAIYVSITTHIQPQYNIDVNADEVNKTKTLEKLPKLQDANCRPRWRTKHRQKQMNDKALLQLIQERIKYQYFYHKVPKSTFTYWLSHIESQHKIQEKAYFADKFLVKQYIEQMKKKFPLLKSINHAHILYDCAIGMPYFETLKNLSKYHGFVAKPNHMSSHQFVIPPNSTLTSEMHDKITRDLGSWLRSKYRVNPRIEPWYALMTPHAFIEEYINIDSSKHISNDQIMEYKISVFNYKAVFCYITVKRDFKKFDGPYHPYVTNTYILPEFQYMNGAHWGRYNNESEIISPMPTRENLDLMIQFAETFARTEQFRYVRVDMYEINKKVYFSEFTFAPKSGLGILRPISFDHCLYDILCDNKQEDFNKLYQYVL